MKARYFNNIKMGKNLIRRVYEKIKKPVLIGASVVAFSSMPYFSGCNSEGKVWSNYKKYYNSLSPEEKRKEDEACYKLIEQNRKEHEQKREQEAIACGELSKHNAEMQRMNQNKSKEERDAEIVDDITKKVGAAAAIEGLMKAVSEHSK